MVRRPIRLIVGVARLARPLGGLKGAGAESRAVVSHGALSIACSISSAAEKVLHRVAGRRADGRLRQRV